MERAAEILEKARTTEKTYKNLWVSLENKFLTILRDERLSDMRFQLTVTNYKAR